MTSMFRCDKCNQAFEGSRYGWMKKIMGGYGQEDIVNAGGGDEKFKELCRECFWKEHKEFAAW